MSRTHVECPLAPFPRIFFPGERNEAIGKAALSLAPVPAKLQELPKNRTRSSICLTAAFAWSAVPVEPSPNVHAAALEATQGQMNGFFGQLPCKCHSEEVASASVGD